MAPPVWVSEQEPPEKKERQKEKRVQVKQGHRAVEQPFDPGGYPLFLASVQQCGSPMVQQKKPGRNGIEQTALRHEHRERNRFPRHISLIVLQGVGLEKEKAGETSVEEK